MKPTLAHAVSVQAVIFPMRRRRRLGSFLLRSSCWHQLLLLLVVILMGGGYRRLASALHSCPGGGSASRRTSGCSCQWWQYEPLVVRSCIGLQHNARWRRRQLSVKAVPDSFREAAGGIITRAETGLSSSGRGGPAQGERPCWTANTSAAAAAAAAAERAYRKLASTRKAQTSGWDRFRPLVEMAIARSSPAQASTATLVDVGCDHGLLSACLAATGCFRSVLGIDSSRSALESGSFKLRRRMDAFRAKRISQNRNWAEVPPPLVLEYRWGDGLRGLRPGQADIVVVAGMGASTMAGILTGPPAPKQCRGDEAQSPAAAADSSTDRRCGMSRLDELGCRTVLVQPTCARPRNLLRLYEALGSAGYSPTDERIVRANSRWCFSAAFQPSRIPTDRPKELVLPGSILAEAASAGSPDDATLLLDFTTHYCRWLHQDARAGGGSLGEGEDEWLSNFDAIRNRLLETRCNLRKQCTSNL
jgi:hypothetical protein